MMASRESSQEGGSSSSGEPNRDGNRNSAAFLAPPPHAKSSRNSPSNSAGPSPSNSAHGTRGKDAIQNAHSDSQTAQGALGTQGGSAVNDVVSSRQGAPPSEDSSRDWVREAIEMTGVEVDWEHYDQPAELVEMPGLHGDFHDEYDGATSLTATCEPSTGGKNRPTWGSRQELNHPHRHLAKARARKCFACKQN